MSQTDKLDSAGYAPDSAAVRRFQARAAAGYSAAAHLSTLVGERLFERLDGLRFEPESVLDLGCGPGNGARLLAQRWPGARVLAVDAVRPMLDQVPPRLGWFGPKLQRLQADAARLPLGESTVDLLFCNLVLHALEDLPGALNGFRRVLRPGGLLLISIYGRDTLRELREAGRRIGDVERVGRFADVQRLGDAMMRAGFAEPVLDTDWITVQYRDPGQLFAELKACGLSHAARARSRGLTTPRRLAALRQSCETFRSADGTLLATWEIVYASAWAPEEGAPIRSIHGEEASVSVASIGKRRR